MKSNSLTTAVIAGIAGVAGWSKLPHMVDESVSLPYGNSYCGSKRGDERRRQALAAISKRKNRSKP